MKRENCSSSTAIASAAILAIWWLVGPSQAAPQISIPKPLTLSWTINQIKSHGAKYVVDALSSQDRYEELLKHIDLGESDWVALAPELAPGTDAATAEELAISLALGLPRNSAAVLSVLDPRTEPLAPERVCGVPFIEGTVKDIPGYIRRSQSALQRVQDARLAERKTECLNGLNEAAKTIQVDRRK
jgi:hypothetical protein